MWDVWRGLRMGWLLIGAAAWAAWELAPAGGGRALAACGLCAAVAWWLGWEAGREGQGERVRELRQRLLAAELADWGERKRRARAGG